MCAVQALLHLRDYLRTPLTILEGLENGRPSLDCFPSCFCACRHCGSTFARDLASHAINRVVIVRVLHFLFPVASGLMQRVSPKLLTQTCTGFSVYLISSNTESCDEGDEEVGVVVVEELVDKPGTTNGT